MLTHVRVKPLSRGGERGTVGQYQSWLFRPYTVQVSLPRMNMVPPVKAGVATDSSPSSASATETNVLDARKTCIVPALSMAKMWPAASTGEG